MFEEIIKNNKKRVKVAITTNISKDLKNELKKFCNENNIAINSVIESLVSKFLIEVKNTRGIK